MTNSEEDTAQTMVRSVISMGVVCAEIRSAGLTYRAGV